MKYSCEWCNAHVLTATLCTSMAETVHRLMSSCMVDVLHEQVWSSRLKSYDFMHGHSNPVQAAA